MRYLVFAAAALLCWLPTADVGFGATGAASQGQPHTWYTFNGDLAAQKFATDTQITPANVSQLRIAWQLHTADVSDGSGKLPATVWSATPLFVNDTLYVSTPFYRIFAIDPRSGKVKWIFKPPQTNLAPGTESELKTRGVAYWDADSPQSGQPCQKIVYVGTMDAKLWAVDADAGKLCTRFGNGGLLDADQWNTVNAKFPLSILQPPTVYKNTLFFGWAGPGKEGAYMVAPPGTVTAIDAQTGKLKWQFHPLTPTMEASTGQVNVWANMSVDEEHGLVYLPTSPPSPDYYGGNRKQPIPYGNAVIALNADTGAVVWSRQFVHHDLWDYDISTAPTLVNLHRNGQTIPVMVVPTKMGLIFVVNRLTGEPIFPIEEHTVAISDVPGEESAATQPWESVPEPTIGKWPGIESLANLTSVGYCSREFRKLRYNGLFTPPSLGAGSLTYPGPAGGIEWGGGAVDPQTNTYVVNSSNSAFIYRLIPRKDFDLEKNQAGDPDDYYPMAGAPYGIQIARFTNYLGMPCWKPPYGTISSYDLNTGKLLWREPFGEVQKRGFYMPSRWGSVTIGAPVITQSGLIFIGASMDSRVRALDLKTGKVLWMAQVQAPAVAVPAVFTYKGREYVVFTAGGNSTLTSRLGDQLVAFALPQGRGG